MIKTFHAQNFQSLRDVKLEFGQFNVIVGQSDSGKSALFRALSTLVSNKRGADFVTHGQKTCTLTAELDQGTLVLQRGKATNDNFYEVRQGDHVETFTKLGGATPEEVSAFLTIPAKDPVNFASQFDKPYLLDTKEYGPSETARILGSLTNVNVLFEGAKESNRRKTQTSSTLRTRESDLEEVTEDLKSYTDLEAIEASVVEAEALIEQARKFQSMLEQLQDILDTITREEAALARTAEDRELEIPNIDEIELIADQLTTLQTLIATSRQAEAAIAGAEKRMHIEVPDASQIEKLVDAHKSLLHCISEHQKYSEIKHREDQQVAEASAMIEELQQQYEDTLAKEGRCPTCNQLITSS